MFPEDFDTRATSVAAIPNFFLEDGRGYFRVRETPSIQGALVGTAADYFAIPCRLIAFDALTAAETVIETVPYAGEGHWLPVEVAEMEIGTLIRGWVHSGVLTLPPPAEVWPDGDCVPVTFAVTFAVRPEEAQAKAAALQALVQGAMAVGGDGVGTVTVTTV